MNKELMVESLRDALDVWNEVIVSQKMEVDYSAVATLAAAFYWAKMTYLPPSMTYAKKRIEEDARGEGSSTTDASSTISSWKIGWAEGPIYH